MTKACGRCGEEFDPRESNGSEAMGYCQSCWEAFCAHEFWRTFTEAITSK